MARQVKDAAATAMLVAAGAVTADGTAVGAAVSAAGGAPAGVVVLQRLHDTLNEQRCLSLKSAPRALAQARWLTATCFMLLAPCYLLIAACYSLLATRHLLLATLYLLLTSLILLVYRCNFPLAQVLLAADYMGLPYGGEHGTDLLWIADAFLCPQLPLGWEAMSRARGISGLGQRALRRLLSAPDHASGCLEPRRTSANPPLGPRWPATPALLSRHRWEEFPSEDGPPYYQNLWTGECMWEHPQRAFLRGVAEAAATLRDAQQKVDAAILLQAVRRGTVARHESAVMRAAQHGHTGPVLGVSNLAWRPDSPPPG